MTTMLTRSVLLVLLCCVSVCEDTFAHLEYRLPFAQRLLIELKAPLIVIGEVLQVTELGEPQHSPGDPRILTQKTGLVIRVEEVVKGSYSSNTLQMFYFAYSSKNKVELGVRRYRPQTGQRRVYFLRRSVEGYRSIGDVTDYTLAVWSGRHPKGFCKGKEAGCCIAELLLTPGNDLVPHRFAENMTEASYVASVVCSKSVSETLIRALADFPDKSVSQQASILLKTPW